MQALSTTAADTVEQVFTLVLQNEQHNALHDAKTFSNLLCVNQQLRQALLASAVGRISLFLPADRGWETSHRDLILGAAASAVAHDQGGAADARPIGPALG